MQASDATGTGGISAWFRRESALLGALAVALFLRTFQLAHQSPADDEWHALVMSASAGLREILTSFGGSDHSIPMTAYFEVVADTLGLCDVTLRGPMVVGGMLLVLAVGLVFRRALGRGAGDLAAWLVALSPFLTFFSRFARPYVLAGLLGFLALAALMRFAAGQRRLHAALYVGAALLASWFLLSSLPALLAPLGWLAWRRLKTGAGPSVARLVSLGALVAGGLGLLLAPALLGDFDSLSGRFGQGRFDLGMQLVAVRVLLGLCEPWLVVPLVLVAAHGVRVQLREAPEWAALGLVVFAAQWCATAWVLPPRGDIFARYALPVLPFVLGWLASGLVALRARSGAWLVPAALLVLVAAGPFPRLPRRIDDWFASRLLIELLSGADLHARTVRATPGFYATLDGLEPGSVTLIEAPVPLPFVSNAMPVYQGRHRQRTRIGIVSAPDFHPPVEQLPYGYPYASEQILWLEDVRRGAGQGDYLVLHKDLVREATARAVPLGPFRARLEERLGAPCFEDELVAVFDLR